MTVQSISKSTKSSLNPIYRGEPLTEGGPGSLTWFDLQTNDYGVGSSVSTV